MQTEHPLFPLHTVLLPGGALPLRIFEPRYVDMVSRCLRDELAFGVVPITQGMEAGGAASFLPSGTLAMIETWDKGKDGLLELLARGTQRITVHSHELQPDGLVVGQVEVLEQAPEAVPAAHRFVAELLERAFREHPEIAPPEPWQLNDATWLAYRCADLMPLDARTRLDLLELDTGADKLARVAALIPSADNPPEGSARH